LAQRLFDKGRQGHGDGTINTSSGTFKARILNLQTTSNIIKAISACTNAASPITVTVASTSGWANGNIVLVQGIAGNTAANGLWVVANLTGTTFDLQTLPPPGGSQLAATGNGTAVVTNATVLNLSLTSASTDLPSGAGSSTDQTLSSITFTNGIFNSANPTWNNVAATTLIQAIAVYQSLATDRLVFFTDGKLQVRIDKAASTSDTTLIVEPLYAAIPSGTVLVFSNGVSATLTVAANAGDRALTVSAISAGIAIGHTADAPITNWGLPATLGSQPTNVTFQVDSTNGWYKI
jgi:hypothetical protein